MILVTAVALTTPVVFEWIVFKSVAAALPSLMVVATLANLLIPFALRALATSSAEPIINLAAVATTVPVVIKSIKLRSIALTDVSVTVTAAIDEGAFSRIAFNCAIVALLSPAALFLIVNASPAFHPVPAAKIAAVFVTLLIVIFILPYL